MLYHSLLQQQLKDLLPPAYSKDAALQPLLQKISDHYFTIDNHLIGTENITATTAALDNEDGALQKTLERYEYVTKATFDAIWDWDIERQMVYRGDGYQTLFGYNIDDIRKKNHGWELLIHPDERMNVLQSFTDALAGTDGHWAASYRYKMADGEYAHVEDKAVIIRDNEGKAYRMIGAMQNVSQQRKKEEKLKLFESIITHSNDGVVVLMPSAEAKISYVNIAFCNITGYSKDELAGKSISILKGVRTNMTSFDWFMNALKDDMPAETELTLYHKDGTVFTANFSSVAVNDDVGLAYYWVIMVKDITSKKRRDEEKEVYYKVLNAINSNLDLNKGLKQVLKYVGEYLGVDYAEIWSVNIDKTQLLPRTTWKNNNLKEQVLNNAGSLLANEAFGAKEITHWPDLAEQSNTSFISKDLLQMRQAIATPILFKDDALAVLIIYSIDKGNGLKAAIGLLERIMYGIGAEMEKNRIDDELNRFFKLSPDLLGIAGVDGYFKKINPSFTALLGYSEEEFLARPILTFLHKDDKAFMADRYAELSKRKQPQNLENRFMTKDGNIKWLSWTVLTLQNEGMVYAVGKDITEKIASATELETQKVFYEEVLNGMPNDVAVFNDKHEYLFVNPQAIRNSVLRQWIIGKTDEDFCRYKNLPLEIAAKRRNYFKQVITSKQKFEWEEKLETEDGVFYYLRGMYPLPDAEGNIPMVIGYGINITLLKKAEQERISLVEELTKNNADLKQFSYITSHNLRAPLTNLVAIANLIDIDHVKDERQRKLIEGFKISTYHLDATLNDLIKVLVLKETRDLQMEQVNLPGLLNYLLTSIRSQVEEVGARIDIDFANIDTITTHRGYIESIFINLITNSIRYAHAERKPVLKISSIADDQWITLRFADNGIGFNMEKVKNRIFGLYQRFHDHKDSKGIGLYLVRTQVVALGGEITVDSEENKGSVFTIKLKNDHA